MVTNDIIGQVFISRVVSRDVNIIYNTQEQVMRAYFNRGSGQLSSFIARKPFYLQNSGSKQDFYMRIFPYLRFLDIRYASKSTRRGLALYNRVIWGVLYNETLPDLMYGLTQDIKDSIGAELHKAEELEQADNW